MVSIQNKKIIIGIVLIISFLVIAFNIPPLLELTSTGQTCGLVEGCQHEQQLNFLESILPVIISIALAVGAGTYYLMSQKVEEKKVSIKKQSDIILKFLSQDEKKLVNLLIENNGRVLQAEVTRLPEMSKLKSHRVVQKLLDKGVIEKESMGKTNVIKFSEEVRQGLL